MKIKKDILKTIAKDYKIIVVTGTNGKTTTTSMIYNIFKENGEKVITNGSGANLITGIVTTFIKNYKFFSKNDGYAIIEVDEANLKFFTEYISPEIITITNLFRDQLDRYGEVYTTLNILIDAIKKSPSSKLILNGDESLLGDLDLPNEILYYGFNEGLNSNVKVDINADAKFCKKCGAMYKYNFITYNHLGSYYCESCGFAHPTLKYGVDKVLETTPSYSDILINGKNLVINQPGSYNIYNGICALAVAMENSISFDVCSKSLSKIQSAFGRQESLNIDNKEVKIILVKNPAGYNEAINTVMLEKQAISVGFLLNDNYADGTDVSWIWDVNFEQLSTINITSILVGGIRKYDMAIRLKIAGMDANIFNLCDDYDALLNSIKNAKNDKVYLLCTYTAMTSLRKYLHEKKYINNLW